jgi:hypothetical protein
MMPLDYYALDMFCSHARHTPDPGFGFSNLILSVVNRLVRTSSWGEFLYSFCD